MSAQDFNFSGFYYPEIREALLQYLDRNVPEITNRSEFEPAVQILSAFALVGHLNNTLLDLVAQESTLPTARLRDSVVDLLRLIGYEPHGDIPATTTLRARLTQILEQETTVVSAGALFATRQSANLPSIPFECLEGLTVGQSATFEEIASLGYSGSRLDGTLSFTFEGSITTGETPQKGFPLNIESDGGSAVGGLEPYVRSYIDDDELFSSRVPSSAIFFGSTTMFDTLSIDLLQKGNLGDNRLGYFGGPQWSLEYSSNTLDLYVPDSVEIGPDGDLLFDVSSILPSSTSFNGSLLDIARSPQRSFDGLEMRVTSQETGLSVWGFVEPVTISGELIDSFSVGFAGTHRLRVKSYLGQTSPSTSPSDYRVGSLWSPVESVSDGTLSERIATKRGIFENVDSGILDFELDLLPNGPLRDYTDEVVFEVRWIKDGNSRRATFNPETGEVRGPISPSSLYIRQTSGFLETGATVRIIFDEGAVNIASEVFLSYSLGELPFQSSGDLSFPVPFDRSRTWERGLLEDFIGEPFGTVLTYKNEDGEAIETTFPSPRSTGSSELYWMRLRLVQLGSISNVVRTDEDPVYKANELTDDLIDPDFSPPVFRASHTSGAQYVAIPVTQGRPISEVVGSSDGTAFQSFTLGTSPVVDSSVQVFVDGSLWTAVADFVSSTSTSYHFRTEIDSEGVGTIHFGDGETGRIPRVGANNIRAVYRVEADSDGNVGADSIIVNRSGMSRITGITNPQSAKGWEPLEGGGGDDDLERLKLDGVASLRTARRVVTLSDVETFATQFKDSRGDSPVKRAKAISGLEGTNSVNLFVVGPSGEFLTTSQLREIEVFFNGDTDEGGSSEGLMMMNTRLIARNYTPAPQLAIEVSIIGGSVETVRAGLLSSVAPLAVDSAGSYVWEFGGTVYPSKLMRLVLEADPSVLDVAITSPSTAVVSDVNRASSLPVAVSVSVTKVTL